MATNVLNLKRKRETESDCGSGDPKVRLEDEPEIRRVKTEEVPTATTEFLKLALQKINQLYEELEEKSSDEGEESEEEYLDDHNDSSSDSLVQAEALGYAMCAQETISFLINEGFSEDCPLIQNLRHRLMNRLDP